MRIYLDEIKCRMIRNGEMYDYTKTKIPVREKNLYFLVRTEKKMSKMVDSSLGNIEICEAYVST